MWEFRTHSIGQGPEDSRHHARQGRRNPAEGVAEGRWRLRGEAHEAFGGPQGYPVRQQEEKGLRLFLVRA